MVVGVVVGGVVGLILLSSGHLVFSISSHGTCFRAPPRCTPPPLFPFLGLHLFTLASFFSFALQPLEDGLQSLVVNVALLPTRGHILLKVLAELHQERRLALAARAPSGSKDLKSGRKRQEF